MPIPTIQTITVIISFLGVVIGVILFYWGKRLERRSVNTAILAEIRRLIYVVDLHRIWWENPKNADDRAVPLIPFSTPVYDEQVKNIGLLDCNIVAKVAEFYGYLQFINSLQESRSAYPANKNSQFEKTYGIALTKFCATYADAFDEAFARRGLLEAKKRAELHA